MTVFLFTVKWKRKLTEICLSSYYAKTLSKKERIHEFEPLENESHLESKKRMILFTEPIQNRHKTVECFMNLTNGGKWVDLDIK